MPHPRSDQHAEYVRRRLGRLVGPPESQEPESEPLPAPSHEPEPLPAPSSEPVSVDAVAADPHEEPVATPDGSPEPRSAPDPAAPARRPLGDRTRRLSGRIAEAFGVRGARLDPGRSGFRALAAVAVIAVAVAAVVAWRHAPQPEPVTAPRGAAATIRPSASAAGVVVSVTGRVRRPGLVTLHPGARVADAIDAAGGLLPDTDVGYLNLARKVSDGELIVVGVTPPPGAAPDAGAPGAPAAPGDPAGKLNLNTATATQLETLPGVGPVLAQNIIDYRDEHGGFRSVNQLRQVNGIGPARYDQLKDLVAV